MATSAVYKTDKEKNSKCFRLSDGDTQTKGFISLPKKRARSSKTTRFPEIHLSIFLENKKVFTPRNTRFPQGDMPLDSDHNIGFIFDSENI